MRSFIIITIIHLTLNIFVFMKGWKLFKRQKTLRVSWSVIFAIEFLSYCIGLLFHRFLPSEIVHFIRVAGASWMLFLFYFGGLVLLTDLLYLIFRKCKNRFVKIKPTVFLSTIALVIVVLVYGNYKFKHPIVNHVNIEIDKPAGKIDSVRIAVVGDMHLGYLINKDDARRMVGLIMAQQPDLILLVGDLIDSSIKPVVKQKMDEELRQLRAPLGVYSCTGNHEFRYETKQKIAFLNNAGIKILRDSAVLIDSSFYVVGREDFVYPKRIALAEILKRQNIDMSKPVIVLNHTPNNLDEEAASGTDIALYGHTHHGQAFPGNIATQLIYEVAYGYKRKGNTHVYVTSGLGLAGPQHRIGTVSELVILTVKFAKQ